MPVKKSFHGRDAFYRMCYLYQLAELCRKMSGEEYKKLMLHYGSQLVSIGKKSQSRMSPKMKRTLCKGCCSLLVPGDTSSFRVVRSEKEPDKMVVQCQFCGVHKVFNLRKGYKLWCEKEQAVTGFANQQKKGSDLKDTNSNT